MPLTIAAQFARGQLWGGASSAWTLLAITVVTSAFALGTPAAATGLYSTKRVLAHTENECLNLRKHECRTIRSPRVALKPGDAARIELACVPGHPFLVGWDAAHHEHIGLTLVSDRPVDLRAGATASAAPGKPESVTVLAVNHAGARGIVTLFIGCSAEPIVGAPFPGSKHGLPTRALQRIGN